MIRRCPPLLSMGCVLICLVGCGSGQSVETASPVATENLRKISRAYLGSTLKANRPPRNLGDILPFLEKEGTPAEILRSPDDGEDYVIHWGVDYRNARPQGGAMPVIAYERRGKRGKRYVLQIRNIVHLTDKELEKAPFPPGVKSPF